MAQLARSNKTTKTTCLITVSPSPLRSPSTRSSPHAATPPAAPPPSQPPQPQLAEPENGEGDEERFKARVIGCKEKRGELTWVTDYGDEWEDRFHDEPIASFEGGGLMLLHKYHDDVRVEQAMDKKTQDNYTDMCEVASKASHTSLACAVNHKGSKAKRPKGVNIILYGSFSVPCPAETFEHAEERCMGDRVNTGEVRVLPPAAGRSFAECFRKLKRPTYKKKEKVMRYRQRTRAAFTNIFGGECGLRVPKRPRLVPLPKPGDQQACHAICPVGHLKVPFGGYGVDTAVALLDEANGSFKAWTILDNKPLRPPIAAVAMSFPIEVSYHFGDKRLSVRFRPVKMDDASAFQYKFSPAGYN